MDKVGMDKIASEGIAVGLTVKEGKSHLTVKANIKVVDGVIVWVKTVIVWRDIVIAWVKTVIVLRDATIKMKLSDLPCQGKRGPRLTKKEKMHFRLCDPVKRAT